MESKGLKESKKSRESKGPFKAEVPPSFYRGKNEKVNWITRDTDPKDAAEILQTFRHGDIDASPVIGYRIMIYDTLVEVSLNYLQNLPLKVTELIEDPMAFYEDGVTMKFRMATLSAKAHGDVLATVAGGRRVTTRRRFVFIEYDYDSSYYTNNGRLGLGYNIMVDGEWQLFDSDTPEEYLHDSDAAVAADAAAAAEDDK